MSRPTVLAGILLLMLPMTASRGAETKGSARSPGLIRSSGGGNWSAPTTWEGGTVPSAGDKVQVRAGHVVTYDIVSEQAIRSIHVA